MLNLNLKVYSDSVSNTNLYINAPVMLPIADPIFKLKNEVILTSNNLNEPFNMTGSIMFT